MNKIVCIVGPTGVGKTDLAFKTAQKYNGELVSADSVQVYKGLDIISGKDIPKTTKYFPLPELSDNGFYTGYYNYNSIPIFLLDVVEPTSSFSVSQFQELANKTIGFISKKNKLPIIVGGTGFYVKSLIDGLDNLPEPDLELRKKLDGLNVAKLQGMISAEKLASMNASDRNNKRRLIRKIEIASSQLSTTSYPEGASSAYKPPTNYDSLMIGLYCEKEVLKQRIDERVEKRLESGALEEAKELYKNYDNLSQQVKDANGYKQLFQYLQNKVSLEETINKWKISEYHHAKNQMTWFRKYGDVKWFDIEDKGYEKEIEKTITQFLQ